MSSINTLTIDTDQQLAREVVKAEVRRCADRAETAVNVLGDWADQLGHGTFTVREGVTLRVLPRGEETMIILDDRSTPAAGTGYERQHSHTFASITRMADGNRRAHITDNQSVISKGIEGVADGTRSREVDFRFDADSARTHYMDRFWDNRGLYARVTERLEYPVLSWSFVTHSFARLFDKLPAAEQSLGTKLNVTDSTNEASVLFEQLIQAAQTVVDRAAESTLQLAE